MNTFQRKLSFGVEEALLVLIIVLNILDALEVLPSTWDYIKKIISWALLGYLLYSIDMSSLFVGVKNKKINILLLSGYFLFIIKNLVSYAHAVLHEASSFLEPFFQFLLVNASVIERGGIYAGLFLILYATIHITFHTPLRRPSIIGLLLSPKRHGVRNFYVKKFVSALIVIFLFFSAVFNIMMEWLAIAIDAPLIMIGLIMYIALIIKYHRHIKPGTLLAKISSFGENLYKDIISHLKYKKTVFKALGGILILHFLTDALVFLIPFVTSLSDPLYSGVLQQAHPWIGEVFIANIMQTGANVFVLGAVYLANCVALCIALLAPVGLWFLLYQKARLHITPWLMGVSLGSGYIALQAPLFSIQALRGEALFGVDIIASPIQTNSLIQTAVIGCCIGVLVWLAHRHKPLQQYIHLAWLTGVQVFFTTYIVLFVVSLSAYYFTIIPLQFRAGLLVIALFLVINILASFVFYGMGTFHFNKEVFAHWKSTRWFSK